jgi:hypothetical protein
LSYIFLKKHILIHDKCLSTENGMSMDTFLSNRRTHVPKGFYALSTVTLKYSDRKKSELTVASLGGKTLYLRLRGGHNDPLMDFIHNFFVSPYFLTPFREAITQNNAIPSVVLTTEGGSTNLAQYNRRKSALL